MCSLFWYIWHRLRVIIYLWSLSLGRSSSLRNVHSSLFGHYMVLLINIGNLHLLGHLGAGWYTIKSLHNCSMHSIYECCTCDDNFVFCLMIIHKETHAYTYNTHVHTHKEMNAHRGTMKIHTSTYACTLLYLSSYDKLWLDVILFCAVVHLHDDHEWNKLIVWVRSVVKLYYRSNTKCVILSRRYYNLIFTLLDGCMCMNICCCGDDRWTFQWGLLVPRPMRVCCDGKMMDGLSPRVDGWLLTERLGSCVSRVVGACLMTSRLSASSFMCSALHLKTWLHGKLRCQLFICAKYWAATAHCCWQY